MAGTWSHQGSPRPWGLFSLPLIFKTLPSLQGDPRFPLDGNAQPRLACSGALTVDPLVPIALVRKKRFLF